MARRFAISQKYKSTHWGGVRIAEYISTDAIYENRGWHRSFFGHLLDLQVAIWHSWYIVGYRLLFPTGVMCLNYKGRLSAFWGWYWREGHDAVINTPFCVEGKLRLVSFWWTSGWIFDLGLILFITYKAPEKSESTWKFNHGKATGERGNLSHLQAMVFLWGAGCRLQLLNREWR